MRVLFLHSFANRVTDPIWGFLPFWLLGNMNRKLSKHCEQIQVENANEENWPDSAYGKPICCVHCMTITSNFTIAVWNETSSPEKLSNLLKVVQVVSDGTSLWYSNHAHGTFILRWFGMGMASPSSPPKSCLKLPLVTLFIIRLAGPLVYCTWH